MSAPAELLQKGRYRLDSPALTTATGTVHQAYDTTSDTNVFVKEIVVRLNKVTTLAQQENNRLAFENAAKRIAEFRHDSLLAVKDFYSEVGRQYLVLENVEGEDLHSILEAGKKPFPVEKALDWADQILDAANYLHNQKPPVLHGNICPRNIKLQPNGKVKLLGVTIKDDSGNDISTALTEVNDGNLNFSPLELIWDNLDAASQKVIINNYDERSEKILKEPADFRSDIYSIGATLYFLLTARIPADPLERSIELLEGNKDPLSPPSTIDAGIAPEISEVVMRALEIKRENRFDSAMIMRQVLRTAIVRVKEREAAEAREMDEAAEALRNTQQLKMPVASPPPAVQQPSPAPAESSQSSQPSEAEILAQKLREAEEMRIEAERRAAEAERLLREQEAEKARLEELARAAQQAPAKPEISGDDLLDISSEPVHTSAAPVSDVDDEIHLSVRPEPRAKIDLRAVAKTPATPKPPEPTAPVTPAKPGTTEADVASLQMEEPPVATEAEPVATREFDDQPAAEAFEMAAEEPKRGLPIPLLAGVGAFVLIAVVLGFVFLGGTSTESPAETQTAAPQQVQPEPQPQAEQPAEIPATVAEEPAAGPEQPASAFQENPQVSQPHAEEPQTSSRPAAKPVQTPKSKPAEPAKTPAPKKQVTVDDLINDN